MKWFEHQTAARHNKKLRKLEAHFGERGGPDAAMAAVGRFWRLLEVIGGEGLDESGLDLYQLPGDYTLDLVALDLRCDREYLEEFLGVLAEINALDPEAWEQGAISCPKLAERMDSYAKRGKRLKIPGSENGGGAAGKPKAGAAGSKDEQTSNSVRTNFEGCSNSVRTNDEECSSPQAQTQTQTQAQALQLSGCVAGPGKPAADATPGFGPAKLAAMWNDLGCRPQVSELTDERRKKAGLRIRKRGDPEWWRVLFAKAKGLDKPWLTFDFLLSNDTNCLKLLEGNYDRDFGRRSAGRGGRPEGGTSGQARKYDGQQNRVVIDDQAATEN